MEDRSRPSLPLCMLSLLILLVLIPSLSWGEVVQLSSGSPESADAPRELRWDFEHNTSGVLDMDATHVGNGSSWQEVTATIHNDSGHWLRLRELSFPAMIMDWKGEWHWHIWTGMSGPGPPPTEPGSPDFTGSFPPPEGIWDYTVLPLDAWEIYIAPGEFFSAGYGSPEGHRGLRDVVTGDTYNWWNDDWQRCENNGYTLLIQIMAEYVDTGEIVVYPDGTGLYPTIQKAIDAVLPGGTVLLADGVFSGPGNIDLDFGGKHLTLKSVSEDPSTCIIDCSDPPRGREARGLRFVSGEGPDAVVEYISVLNGWTEGGPGIRISNSSPTIRHCVFDNGYCIDGGGILINKGSPEIVGCTFLNGDAGYGGGILSRLASPSIRHCRFESNQAGVAGGAIYMVGCPDALIEHCVFYDNTAKDGAGIFLGNSPLQITSCTFAENEAANGSGIFVEGEGPEIWTSLIVFGQGDALYCVPNGRALPELVCCDLFGNTGGDWTGCIADQWGVDGNFSDDPQFCGELGTGNLTLQDDSPCAPGGNGCGLLIGGETVECDDTYAAATTWSRLKQLY